jgi:phosphoglycolate phosphatase
MKHNLNLLIFDWDGTLMDSEATIIECVRAAAVDLDLEIPGDDSIRNIIGLGLSEAVMSMFPGADEKLVAAVIERYRYHFLHEERPPTPLFENAEGVLRELEQRGYLLAVATGKGRVGLDRVLAETTLDSLFHATRCADETLSKPHPEMLLQLMDELGAMADETVMIGDTEWDMLMARNAGTHSIAVSYGAHERERLLQHSPLTCVDSIGEIVGWLDGVQQQ